MNASQQRSWNILLAAREVRCCPAGRREYPRPCPWHGRSDPQYELVTSKGEWFA